MKNYKDATEKEIISILRKQGFNPVKESDLKTNTKGQFVIEKTELVITELKYYITMVAVNIPKAKKASSILKKLGYYTVIVRQTANFIAIYIATEPMKNKEETGNYL